MNLWVYILSFPFKLSITLTLLKERIVILLTIIGRLPNYKELIDIPIV
jgi:hypothetical protein